MEENNNQQFTQDTQMNQQPTFDSTYQVMSIGSYVGMFILSAIPIVNIICWIVWLCSKDTNKNKKNYIIASIILFAIYLGITILFVILATTGVISLAALESAADAFIAVL